MDADNLFKLQPKGKRAVELGKVIVDSKSGQRTSIMNYENTTTW